MNVIVVACALMIGAEQVDEVQQKREWLFAHLVNVNFDSKQIKKLQAKLSRMTPSQINVLVEVYKMRWAQREKALQEQRRYREQMLLAQAQLNLNKVRAYRDHLAREYQYKILTENWLLEFMKQSRHMVLGNMYRNGYCGNRRRGYYRGY